MLRTEGNSSGFGRAELATPPPAVPSLPDKGQGFEHPEKGPREQCLPTHPLNLSCSLGEHYSLGSPEPNPRSGFECESFTWGGFQKTTVEEHVRGAEQSRHPETWALRSELPL